MAWAVRASEVVLAAVDVLGRKEKIDGIAPALIAPPLMSRRARAGELGGAPVVASVLSEKISTAAGGGGAGGAVRSLPRRNDGSVLSSEMLAPEMLAPALALVDVPEADADETGAMDARGIRRDAGAFAFVLADVPADVSACARGADASASASMSALHGSNFEKRNRNRKSVIAK